MDISERFETNHKQALVITLHKNQLADAYSVFLFDDYERAKQLIDGNLDSFSLIFPDISRFGQTHHPLYHSAFGRPDPAGPTPRMGKGEGVKHRPAKDVVTLIR